MEDAHLGHNKSHLSPGPRGISSALTLLISSVRDKWKQKHSPIPSGLFLCYCMSHLGQPGELWSLSPSGAQAEGSPGPRLHSGRGRMRHSCTACEAPPEVTHITAPTLLAGTTHTAPPPTPQGPQCPGTGSWAHVVVASDHQPSSVTGHTGEPREEGSSES